MKYTIDTEAKTITLESEISFDELEKIKKFVGDFEGWKIRSGEVSFINSPDTFRVHPDIRFPYTGDAPYNPLPTLCVSDYPQAYGYWAKNYAEQVFSSGNINTN